MFMARFWQLTNQAKHNLSPSLRMLIVKKIIIGLLLICLILTLVSLSCGGGSDVFGGNSRNLRSNGQDIKSLPVDATATFGADQWHIQLTEMVKPEIK
jgi:hypothetical protein